jgi:hypothetical protein
MRKASALGPGWWCVGFWVVILALGPVACSDKSRRLSEKEAIEYKRDLLQRRGSEISFADKELLYFHPARTPRDIDRAFDTLKAKHDREVAADRAALEKSREKPAEKPGEKPPPAPPPAAGGDGGGSSFGGTKSK